MKYVGVDLCLRDNVLCAAIRLGIADGFGESRLRCLPRGIRIGRRQFFRLLRWRCF